MADLIINQAYKPLLLAEDIHTFLNTCDCRLWTNNFTPTSASSTGAFTECTDGGYAAQTPVFGAPFLNGANIGETDAPNLTYVFSHSGGDFSVHGAYLTDPGNADTWVMAQTAGTPLPITAAGQLVQVGPRVLLDQIP